MTSFTTSSKPLVGHRVLYFLPDGPHAGEPRPAVVVRVWSETCVNLQVFTDGENDGPQYASGIVWVTSALYDEDAEPAPRTWKYPLAYFRPLTFAETVAYSKDMSTEQKLYWLDAVRDEFGESDELKKLYVAALGESK